MTPVVLDAADWAVVEAHLKAIMDSHSKGAGKRDQNRRVDTARTDLQVHKAGIVGEVAFGKWASLPLQELRKRGGDGNGPDFMLTRYEGINVKTTLPMRNLLPRLGAPLNAHYYGLLWWDGIADVVRLVGWVDRSELMAAGHRRDFGIGEQLYYPFDKLTDFGELEAAVGGWIRLLDDGRLR